MQRRKFVIGLGSLAAGGAATLSTGATTQVNARREAEVALEDDADAFLGLKPGAENGDYVQDGSGQVPDGVIAIEMNGAAPNGIAGSGTGVNANALSFFDDLFRVVNQGDDTTNVSIEISEFGPAVTNTNISKSRIDFYQGSFYGASSPPVATDTGNTNSLRGSTASVGVGQELHVGLAVDLRGLTESDYKNSNGDSLIGKRLLREMTVKASD